MGIIPLQFVAGQNADSLGLTGEEEFDVELSDSMKPQQKFKVTARGASGLKTFEVMSRIDTPVEIEYYRNGGILHTVLKNIAKAK